MFARSLLAIMFFLSGFVFVYAGYVSLDVVPGLPLGLAMMAIGSYASVVMPILLLISSPSRRTI